jgi:hypothetical protein
MRGQAHALHPKSSMRGQAHALHPKSSLRPLCALCEINDNPRCAAGGGATWGWGIFNFQFSTLHSPFIHYVIITPYVFY